MLRVYQWRWISKKGHSELEHESGQEHGSCAAKVDNFKQVELLIREDPEALNFYEMADLLDSSQTSACEIKV